MNIHKIINRRIRHHGDTVDLVGDVNAVIAANVSEKRGAVSHASSTQRISQHKGETVVSDEEGNKQEGTSHVDR